MNKVIILILAILGFWLVVVKKKNTSTGDAWGMMAK